MIDYEFAAQASQMAQSFESFIGITNEQATDNLLTLFHFALGFFFGYLFFRLTYSVK